MDIHIPAPELATHEGRSFYSARVDAFLRADPTSIVGALASRQVAFHASAEAEQIRAWEREIEILRATFSKMGSSVERWWVLLEMPLLRLAKRLDAIVLTPGVVAVLEFKIGAKSYLTQDRLQTERYAYALRDFHEASQDRTIVPILCAELAPTTKLDLTLFETVADVLFTNATTLGDALLLASKNGVPESASFNAFGFDRAAYRPTPTIVEAAQALYAGHKISDIGRGDAADGELQATASTLQEIVAKAARDKARTICFITGAPGAGKTLLGLDLALKSRDGANPAALLSGNRPLVHVLTEALASDLASRTSIKKSTAKYQADAAIQNLLGYLKEHTDGAVPPEHVIVFDEAQRAWDADVGQELMGRPSSEPELFLGILERLDWSCLVCLVGPGQEINRGEGGLSLWGEALAKAAQLGRPWNVIAAPQAIHGGPDVPGLGLTGSSLHLGPSILEEPRLHLANSIRAYRNPLQGRWVARLLEGDIDGAAKLARDMDQPPAWITRDIDTARNWLRRQRRGGRSVGLLASSGAVRLLGEGIPPTLRSNELAPIGHWFLKPYTDFRSAGALEVPMSEFGCQGLELDYVGLCWGGDLIWKSGSWLPRKMSSPKWQVLREPEKLRFRLNGYRVLLTRGRAGTIIYVPRGNEDDATRSPAEFNQVAKILENAGCGYLISV